MSALPTSLLCFVERRGNNVRIKFYQGYTNNQRIYTVHGVSREQLDSLGIKKQFNVDQMGINGNQSMGIKDLKSALVDQKVGAGRPAWLGHWLYERPNNVDWKDFLVWIEAKYAKSYVHTIKVYTKKYWQLIFGNPREFDIMQKTVKNNAIKSLIVLSKYLGVHKEFKQRLDEYGIKMYRPDVFASFLRICNNQVTDRDQWYSRAQSFLRPNERVWQRFLALSGLRKNEAITSFNKIIEFSERSNLDGYLNRETGILEHFRFKELFLRGTKNVYISILPPSLISEIQQSTPITYEQVRKRLLKNGLKCRFVELRDYYATFMVRHGLIKEEVDLLQGRIPPSIFLRHYWSPSSKELRDRTLEALRQLESQISVKCLEE